MEEDITHQPHPGVEPPRPTQEVPRPKSPSRLAPPTVSNFIPEMTVLPRRDFILVFVALVSGQFLASLDNTLVNGALPSIMGDFSRLDLYAWIMSAYLLCSACSMPLYGKFSDVFGRRPLFLVAISLFMIGSILCATATSMEFLVAARAVQGLGSGGLTSLTQIIVGDIVPARDRGKYTPIITGCFAFASLFGNVVGGALTDGPGWRWCFWINLPLCCVAILFTALYLKLSRQLISRSIDVPGALVTVLATCALILALTWGGQQYPWTSPIIIALLVAAPLGYALLCWIELRAAEPVVPFRLFTNRNVSLGSFVSFVVGLCMFTVLSYLPLYFQVVKGDSPMVSGLRTVPMMLMLLTSSLGSGYLISRTGKYRAVPVLGTASMSLGLGLLARLTVDMHYGELVVYTLFIGFGMGALISPGVIIVQNSVGLGDMAAVTSLIAFFRLLAGAIGVAVYGSVLNYQLRLELPAELHYLTGVKPKAIRGIVSEEVLAVFAESYCRALARVFLYAVPPMATAWVLSWFYQHHELRRSTAVVHPGTNAASGSPVRAAGMGVPSTARVDLSEQQPQSPQQSMPSRKMSSSPMGPDRTLTNDRLMAPSPNPGLGSRKPSSRAGRVSPAVPLSPGNFHAIPDAPVSPRELDTIDLEADTLPATGGIALYPSHTLAPTQSYAPSYDTGGDDILEEEMLRAEELMTQIEAKNKDRPTATEGAHAPATRAASRSPGAPLRSVESEILAELGEDGLDLELPASLASKYKATD